MTNNPPVILIVDDEAHVRTFYRRALELRYAVRIVEAGDGISALAKADEWEPDLILLDINMPGISGIEVLRRRKAQSPDGRIVIISGDATRATVQICLQEGASAYIRKDTPIAQAFEILERETGITASLHTSEKGVAK